MKVVISLLSCWLFAAVFGDELFALIFFQSAETAFGFSLGRQWWWFYQFAVAALFSIAYLVFAKKRSVAAK